MTRSRRSQAVRVEETRTALMEATIRSLADVGYAATTTREVADRAGVSRGAQTHHFPTKAELVSASIEYLFARQTARFREGFAAIPADERDLGGALGLLWEIITGPTYPAVLELIVAARTDENLRVVVHAMTTVLERTVSDVLIEFFPALADNQRQLRTLIDLGFAVVQGAAVSSYAGFGDPERLVTIARQFAAQISVGVIDA